jgi:hypothetical protein
VLQLRQGLQDEELAFDKEVIERIGAVYAIEARIQYLDADERQFCRRMVRPGLADLLAGSTHLSSPGAVATLRALICLFRMYRITVSLR